MMRRICYLLTAGLLLLVAGRAEAQTLIRFPAEQMSLREALAVIEAQSGLSIAYNEQLTDPSRQVATPSGKTVQETLDIIFAGSGNEALVKGTMILVIKSHGQTPQRVSGTIRDKVGPVAGAVITCGANASMTDLDGKFSITAAPGETLVVSMLGYKEASYVVGRTAEGIEIVLADDSEMLEESVVVGYGTMQRRDITSSIATYKPSEEGERDFISPDAMIQGRVAGVNIAAASGTPGGKTRVSIRGVGSITAGNEPLYVVDGVPMSNTSGDTGAYGGESLSALSDINPADIESIQVLKDAASAAIYGSRGTNGVIIITTRKGAKGKPKFSANANYGLSYLQNLDKLRVADADLYLEVQNEAIDNYNKQTGSAIARLENPFPGKPQFSWLDMVFRVAQSWQAGMSVSGGGEQSDYYLSASVKQNQGVGIGSLYEKYGVKSNLNTQLTSWLKLGAAINLSYTNANRVPDGSIGTSMLTHGLEHRPWDTPFKGDGSYTIINADLLHYNCSCREVSA